MFSLNLQNSLRTTFFVRHYSRISSAIQYHKQLLKTKKPTNENFTPVLAKITPLLSHANFSIVSQRYAKKKKTAKQRQEEEEESDEEDEDFESVESDDLGDATNSVTKTLPSLRLDNVIKAGLGITKS
ncbi:hypothetical protein CEXT_215761 [Caerostris extrusa]|uniref:Uncharacterized protein n=1 Tax=Caerostris extrusa TaxID=172846 RepID=A0AAV4VHU4_CAEEX|nr:hypothetical protein CEXT_215761 [Caerostris extrusa]